MNEELARHYWQRHTIFGLESGREWQARNRAWIEEQVGLYPGFSEALRAIAVEALASDDDATVRRALNVLAVIGHVEDVPRIREIGDARGGSVAKYARAAVFELEHHGGAI